MPIAVTVVPIAIAVITMGSIAIAVITILSVAIAVSITAIPPAIASPVISPPIANLFSGCIAPREGCETSDIGDWRCLGFPDYAATSNEYCGCCEGSDELGHLSS
jgi:hypothetical protein